MGINRFCNKVKMPVKILAKLKMKEFSCSNENILMFFFCKFLDMVALGMGNVGHEIWAAVIRH